MTNDRFYIQDSDAPGKAKILREGLRLFAMNGLAGTSIRDIANATGMSNPALYKHFATKHDVALVLFERIYAMHLMRLTGALRQQPDFHSQLRAFVSTYLESYDESQHATIFASDNLVALWPDMPDGLKQRTAITVLREVLQNGRAEGAVCDKANMDLHLSLVLGMLGQVTRQMYFGILSGPAAQHGDGIVRILRSGLS